ncbi:MAG TPA: hypothetical protein VIB39_03895 [Candidatus Angelobacter sp.]|jgi:hypothetical protein
MPNGNDLPEEQAAPRAAGPFTPFFNPVVALAFTMLLAIVLLIGATVLGLDKGLLLTKMGKVDFARGLITYLFAVVTIGTAVVMVVSALTSKDTPEHKRSFQRGKEILSLLLGVFGTIVGFYFGSEVSGNAQPAEEAIVKIVPLRLSSTSVFSGTDVTVFTYVTGGRAPYRFGVAFAKEDLRAELPVDGSGWVIKTVSAPKTATTDRPAMVYLVVEDTDGHSAVASTPLYVKAVP